MRSTILSIVPFVGFALAQEVCNRPVFTKTETEKVYVTVQPSSLPDVTITSIVDQTVTVTVEPSTSVEASTTGLHWGAYPNGTWSNHTGRPQPILSTVSLVYTPSPITETPAPTSAPSEASTVAQSSSVYAGAGYSSSNVVRQAGSRRGEATFYGGNTSGGMW